MSRVTDIISDTKFDGSKKYKVTDGRLKHA